VDQGVGVIELVFFSLYLLFLLLVVLEVVLLIDGDLAAVLSVSKNENSFFKV